MEGPTAEEDEYPTQNQTLLPAFGQGYNEREAAMASPATKGVVIPRAKESLLIADLDENLDQTDEFIEGFEKDRDTLAQTYQSCEETVVEQFRILRNMLDDREQFHLNQLRQRFSDRDDKLQNQIDQLETHRNANEKTKNDCINLVATMTGNSREERKNRFEMIKDLIDKNIYSSPDIQQVPIDLRYTFETEKNTKQNIETYGKLLFRRIETGRSMPYTRDAKSITTSRQTLKKGGPTRSNNNNNNIRSERPVDGGGDDDDIKVLDVDLPPIHKFMMKCDKEGQLSCDVKLKELIDSNDVNSIFVHVQCVGSSEKLKDFDGVDIDSEQILKLSQMEFNEKLKKYSGLIEGNSKYMPDMQINGRGRFVLLRSQDITESIDDNVCKSGDWSAPNNAKYKGPPGGVGGGSGGSGSSAPNGGGDYINELPGDDPPSLSEEDFNSLEKVKFKCKIIVGDTEKDGKSILLTAKKSELNYDSLLTKIRSAPIIKKSDNPQPDLQIVLTESGNAEINNDNDFRGYVLAKAVGIEKGDLGESLGVVVTAL